MKPQRKLCSILAVGFIVLFFWCIGLYWCNLICNRTTLASLDLGISMAQPKELTPWTPVSYQPGRLSCFFNQSEFFTKRQIGIMRFIQSLQQKSRPIFQSINTGAAHCLDFIYDDLTKHILVRQTEDRSKQIVGYIGPKGYSSTKNPGIGTFEKPIFAFNYCWTSENPNVISLFLYDTDNRRFYRIEMNAKRNITKKNIYYTIAMDSFNITEGPVQKQPNWNPIQICRFSYDDFGIMWFPPYRIIHEFRPSFADQYPGIDPNTMPDSSDVQKIHSTLQNAPRASHIYKNLFILHQNGRIDYLDSKTLTVVRLAGYLPNIGFYKNSTSQCPHDMADYEAKGIYDPNGIYLGMAVAAVSREGMMMAMDFYDAKGNRSAHKTIQEYHDYNSDNWADYKSGVQFLKNTRNGPFLLTIRYLLENLQSPLLRLLDMPAASWIEPDDRYNTFFVHPNSLVGLMKFEFDRFGFWIQLLFLMLPSLIISIWLGFNARWKAASLGYDTSSKDTWFVAIVAFGIPAYVTFRLTLPTQRMVTCANCGNLRRVEFETCQSCKRDWQKTRDLTTAPDWCVRDTTK